MLFINFIVSTYAIDLINIPEETIKHKYKILPAHK